MPSSQPSSRAPSPTVSPPVAAAGILDLAAARIAEQQTPAPARPEEAPAAAAKGPAAGPAGQAPAQQPAPAQVPAVSTALREPGAPAPLQRQPSGSSPPPASQQPQEQAGNLPRQLSPPPQPPLPAQQPPLQRQPSPPQQPQQQAPPQPQHQQPPAADAAAETAARPAGAGHQPSSSFGEWIPPELQAEAASALGSVAEGDATQSPRISSTAGPIAGMAEAQARAANKAAARVTFSPSAFVHLHPQFRLPRSFAFAPLC